MKRFVSFLLCICFFGTPFLPATLSDQKQVSSAFFTMTYDGTSHTYDFPDLEEMDALTGIGGRINQVGTTLGPFDYKGISILSLADSFPSLSSRFTMVAISYDGYVFSFSYDQIQGSIHVYDEEGTMVQNGGVEMILAYREEGIAYFSGGPLRIAFIGKEPYYTDSYLWVKSVKEIEFFDESQDDSSPSIEITKPENAIYLFNRKLIPYTSPVIIGEITVSAHVIDDTEVANVLFVIYSIDDDISVIKTSDRLSPYDWRWDEKIFGTYSIEVTAYDTSGNAETVSQEVFIFNPF